MRRPRRIFRHRVRNDEHGGQIGGALAPTVFGILVTRGSWIAPLVVAACLLFLGAGIWAFWINPEVSVIEKGG
jgi:hypothetical protein